MNRHLVKPCSDRSIAKALECAGEDGICYGKPFYDKEPFNDGEAKQLKSKPRCEYQEQARAWWRKYMKGEKQKGRRKSS